MYERAKTSFLHTHISYLTQYIHSSILAPGILYLTLSTRHRHQKATDRKNPSLLYILTALINTMKLF